MKLVFVIFLACLALSRASLLELSQTLWKRLLDGGIEKVGQLDPLRVPVIKVDQSEGNTSYRITLRNVEIGGLNASTLESVHVARGKLKSNFSELAAGYVTYTDLKDLDTIRYRFHTMVKNEKSVNEGSSQREMNGDYSKSIGGNSQESRSRNYENSRRENVEEYNDEGQRFTVNVMESSRSMAPGVHIIYAQKILKDNERDANDEKDDVECFGECKYAQDTRGRLQQQQQQSQYNQQQNYNPRDQYQQYTGQRNYNSQSQRYTEQQNVEDQNRQFSQQRNYSPPPVQYNQQRNYNFEEQNQQSNQQQNYNAQSNYYKQQQKQYQQQQYQSQQERYKQQPFIQQEYQAETKYAQQPSKSNEDGHKVSSSDNYEYRERFSVQIENQNSKSTEPSSVSKDDSVSFGAHMHPTGLVAVNIQRNQESPAAVYRGNSFSSDSRTSEPFGTQYSNQNPEMYSERVASSKQYTQNSELATETVRDRKGGATVKFLQNPQRSENTEFPSQSETKPSSRFIDIVYTNEKSSEGVKRFGNYEIDPDDLEVKVYGLKELMKDLQESGRYIVHNFTKGEALTKRNDLAQIAAETKRIKDLIRYARNHQEKQGYFEEGMELIYHYGDDDNQTTVESPRKKRAHDSDIKLEDDVMHVILRIRAPVLHVKADYALTGKVGNQIVRGNGVLTGNFTDLIGDFMVELKKAGEDSMVVRAARAKLVAKDRNVSLEGMDRKGPVDVILVHGLMAAEAVAAMIVDDLATKALSEKIADATIYKMYKNLPKGDVLQMK